MLLIYVVVFLHLGVGQSFYEDFSTLTHWKALYFPGIADHSIYSLASENGNSVLQAETHASASGLILDDTINVFETPWLSWRWKIENILEAGDVSSRDTDDYALRIYIFFPFEPARAGTLKKLRYKAARLLYGEYPPQSSLNYIWANHAHNRKFIPNSYTDKSMMILLEHSAAKADAWVTETVNLLEDYQIAFGTLPTAAARLVIMADSDNTGGTARAYMDDIRLSPEDPQILTDESKP
ncbi:MAG: DUF3047 domain-containing protein [FCB group bacterium]|nr:DUF3047 domain-containing protein [FCB group bacterium]